LQLLRRYDKRPEELQSSLLDEVCVWLGGGGVEGTACKHAGHAWGAAAAWRAAHARRLHTIAPPTRAPPLLPPCARCRC